MRFLIYFWLAIFCLPAPLFGGTCLTALLAVGGDASYYREVTRRIHHTYPSAKIRSLGHGGSGMVFEVAGTGNPAHEIFAVKFARPGAEIRARKEYQKQFELKEKLSPEYFLLPEKLDLEGNIPMAYFPYAKQGTLQQMLPILGSQLSGPELTDLFQKIATPLHLLHSQELAHNDFKPSNLYPEFKSGKIVGMKLGDLDTVTFPGGRVEGGMLTVEFVKNTKRSMKEWTEFALTSSFKRDLGAIQRTFQFVALGNISEDNFTKTPLLTNEHTEFRGGVRSANAKLDKIPAVISSLTFPNTKALMAILGAAKKSYASDNPWKAFCPALSRYLNEELSSVEAAEVIDSDLDLQHAYLSGELVLNANTKAQLVALHKRNSK